MSPLWGSIDFFIGPSIDMPSLRDCGIVGGFCCIDLLYGALLNVVLYSSGGAKYLWILMCRPYGAHFTSFIVSFTDMISLRDILCTTQRLLFSLAPQERHIYRYLGNNTYEPCKGDISLYKVNQNNQKHIHF